MVDLKKAPYMLVLNVREYYGAGETDWEPKKIGTNGPPNVATIMRLIMMMQAQQRGDTVRRYTALLYKRNVTGAFQVVRSSSSVVAGYPQNLYLHGKQQVQENQIASILATSALPAKIKRLVEQMNDEAQQATQAIQSGNYESAEGMLWRTSNFAKYAEETIVELKKWRKRI